MSGVDGQLVAQPSLLSDMEILERLVAEDPNCLFVSPLIDPTCQVGPSSLDVRLGTEIRVPITIAATHIDLTASKDEIKGQVDQYFRAEKVADDGSFVIHPGGFALASTLEFVRLPMDLAGRLEGRSSLGRLGLQVHATAGFVDPGFEGTLTFELSNAGRLPVKLAPGLRLGQLCFFKCAAVQVPYSAKRHSKYGGMLHPEPTHVHLDPELG